MSDVQRALRPTGNFQTKLLDRSDETTIHRQIFPTIPPPAIAPDATVSSREYRLAEKATSSRICIYINKFDQSGEINTAAYALISRLACHPKTEKCKICIIIMSCHVQCMCCACTVPYCTVCSTDSVLQYVQCAVVEAHFLS